MENNEEWENIDGYNGIYQISNTGRVKSATRNGTKGGFIEGFISSGYKRVVLTMNGVRKTILVHRLVAQAFIPNPENKPEIDHINTVRDDNRVENLRWVTEKENSNNYLTLMKFKESRTGFRHHLYGVKGIDNPCSKRVIQEDMDGNILKVHVCAKEIAHINGFNYTYFCSVCRNNRIYKGFRWKYVEVVWKQE